MINKNIIRITYLSIISLILILPFLSQRYKYKHSEVTRAILRDVQTMPNGNLKLKFSYKVNEKKFYFYIIGEKEVNSLKIVYNRDNPEEHVFLNFVDIYLNLRMIFLWLLFIIVSALFNITINSSNKSKDEIL